LHEDETPAETGIEQITIEENVGYPDKPRDQVSGAAEGKDFIERRAPVSQISGGRDGRPPVGEVHGPGLAGRNGR